jgi:diguanylate cyclase (GGDEF)-like protein
VSLPDGKPLYLISQVEDISQRKALEEELRHLAQRDSLTALFNRRRFEEEVTRHLALARRYGTPLTLFMIDVDRFKSINDTYGHGAGDEVLQHVAAVLGAQLRETDVVARIGGDEFAVLMPQTESSRSLPVAERIVGAFHEPVVTSVGPVEASVSLGISTAGEGLVALGPLLEDADRAMYRAKATGGGTYSLLEGFSS